MSITDELRKWLKSLYTPNSATLKDEGERIADRIDAELQKAEDEWKAKDGQSWLHGYGECHAQLMEGNETIAADLGSCGWVRLPVDADGEYIRIGDEMEGVDKYDSLKKVMGKVITVSFESDGIVDVAIQAWNSDGKSWHRAYLDPDASVYRHHHAPTVEDVLRQVIACANNGTHVHGALDTEQIVAEYAAKLRLADDEEDE